MQIRVMVSSKGNIFLPSGLVFGGGGVGDFSFLWSQVFCFGGW